MKIFSLRTLIDDILLLVRNNNISESEDLSRAQIASWVLAYKAFLRRADHKEKQAAADDSEWFDDSNDYTVTVGPLELEKVESLDGFNLKTKRTIDELENLYEDDPVNIIAVFDQEYHTIQYMHGLRRHFHYHRKYTQLDYTYDYVNKHIVIKGGPFCEKCDILKYIWVKYIKSDEDDSDVEDEDDVKIPGWMVPKIKELILKNELAFMIKMPSDDDNNSTLDGIKPQTPTPYGTQNPEK